MMHGHQAMLGALNDAAATSRAAVHWSLNAKCHMRKTASVHVQTAKELKRMNEQLAPPCTAKQARYHDSVAPRPVAAQALGSSGFMLHLHQSALFSTAATTAGCLGWTHELRLPVAAGLFCCKRCGHMRCCLLLATHVADLQTFVGLITCNLPYLVWLM